MRPAVARPLRHLLLLSIVATLAVMFREWAYVTTYRLSLADRIDAGADSTAAQRFDLIEGRVVPKIVTRDDRLTFRASVGRTATIRATAMPDGPARYEIRLHRNGVDTIAAEGPAVGTEIFCEFPGGSGDIVLVSHGAITWADPRLERHFPVIASVGVVAALVIGLAVCAPGRSESHQWMTPRAMRIWSTGAVALASVAFTLLVLETTLRAVGLRVSEGIRELRHDLGELTEDPRWQPSAKYVRRLRPNLDVTNEWQYGDIVRMGFLSPAIAEGQVHRYPFRTDAEGFRNAATRSRFDVAALGDSFTDAQTLPVEAAWPAQLEQRLGISVQNYGTASYGPQQERDVLEEYALPHHPRLVVLAFFAGNDIFEAEALDRDGWIDGSVVRPPTLGWPIKTVVSRADTWYVVNALQAASAGIRRSRPATQSTVLASPTSAAPVRAAGFDRGMFSVPVNGRVIRFALMPPYLNTLTISEDELRARRGWALTRATLADMQRASRDAGASFVVMFVPSKSQVVLPLLERTFARDVLTPALQFSLHDRNRRVDVDRMLQNRLALNRLMKEFCEEARIPLLDATDILETRTAAGQTLYFADDSHLNESGEAAIADALATFLETHGLLTPRTPVTSSGREQRR